MTDSGLERGSAMLDSLPEPVVRYLINIARWVRCLSFRQLLTAIYQHYPDMAVNSVIPNVASRNPASRQTFSDSVVFHWIGSDL